LLQGGGGSGAAAAGGSKRKASTANGPNKLQKVIAYVASCAIVSCAVYIILGTFLLTSICYLQVVEYSGSDSEDKEDNSSEDKEDSSSEDNSNDEDKGKDDSSSEKGEGVVEASEELM
jgi:preprotein translocase subunit SecG